MKNNELPKRHTLSLWMDDMGSLNLPGMRDETDALWHINSARNHDNLPHITINHFRSMLAHPKSSAARATLTLVN